MKKELLKEINRIVVHGNCPDGLASAIILHDVIPNAVVEFVIHNTGPYNNLSATKGMIFCDIVPPPDRVDEFVAVDAVVLDHHISAKDIVEKFGKRGVYADEVAEPGVSGAVLAFREVWQPLQHRSHSSEDIVGYFATLAGIVDTWQDQDELWDEANYQSAALMFYSPDQWLSRDSVSSFMTDSDFRLGKNIHERRLKKAKKIAKNCHRFSYRGYNLAVFNDADKLTSDAANFLYREGVNIVAGFYFVELDESTNFPKIVFSLRSDGTVDVSELARWITPKGGGHSQAAGFPWFVKEDSPNPFILFKEHVTKFLDECDDLTCQD